MNDLMNIENVTMTTMMIAELTGKRHDHIIRDYENQCKELGPGPPKFGVLDRINNLGFKVQDKYYNLPKRESLILVSGYSAKMRAAIIDRWIELEAKSTLALPADIDCLGLSIEANNRAVGGEYVVYKNKKHVPLARTPIPIGYQNHADYIDTSNLAAINSMTPHQCRMSLMDQGYLERIEGLGYWPTKEGREVCCIIKVGSYEDKQAFIIGWHICLTLSH